MDQHSPSPVTDVAILSPTVREIIQHLCEGACHTCGAVPATVVAGSSAARSMTTAGAGGAGSNSSSRSRLPCRVSRAAQTVRRVALRGTSTS